MNNGKDWNKGVKWIGPCRHSDGWTEMTVADVRWQECWLCGTQRLPSPTLSQGLASGPACDDIDCDHGSCYTGSHGVLTDGEKTAMFGPDKRVYDVRSIGILR